MRKNKIKPKYILLGTLVFSLIGIHSVRASSIPISVLKNTAIGKLYEEFNYQLQSVENFFQDVVTVDLKNLGDDLGGNLEKEITGTIGDLGIPDITQARQKTEEVASKSDKATYNVDSATNEVERQISRAIIDANLSKNGQEKNKQKTQVTEDAIKVVDTYAQKAQSRVSTQFAIKDIANQNKQIEATLGAIRNDEIQSKITEDLQLANLTNISSAIDSQNKQHRQEIAGETYDILYETSRARLF